MFTSCSKRQIIIDSNQIGIKYNKKLRKTKGNKLYKPDTYNISVNDSLIIYKTSVQSNRLIDLFVISADSIPHELDYSYSYKPEPNQINMLHHEIGPKYNEYMIIPELRVAIRKVIGEYQSKDLQLNSLGEIQNQIFNIGRLIIHEKFVELESFEILEINKIKKQ